MILFHPPSQRSGWGFEPQGASGDPSHGQEAHQGQASCFVFAYFKGETPPGPADLSEERCLDSLPEFVDLKLGGKTILVEIVKLNLLRRGSDGRVL